jgi:hypothetical protein
VLVEIDLTFAGHGWRENESGSCPKDRRREEEETLEIAFELQVAKCRYAEPMDDETEEEPAGRAQIEPGADNAVTRLDESSPGGQDLSKRKGNQDRDNDCVEFEFRDLLKLRRGPTDLTLSCEIRSRGFDKGIRDRRQTARAAHRLGLKDMKSVGGESSSRTRPDFVSLQRLVIRRRRIGSDSEPQPPTANRSSRLYSTRRN